MSIRLFYSLFLGVIMLKHAIAHLQLIIWHKMAISFDHSIGIDVVENKLKVNELYIGFSQFIHVKLSDKCTGNYT